MIQTKASAAVGIRVANRIIAVLDNDITSVVLDDIDANEVAGKEVDVELAFAPEIVTGKVKVSFNPQRSATTS